MAYQKTEWVENETIVSANNLNKIEDQLETLSSTVDRNNMVIDSTEKQVGEINEAITSHKSDTVMHVSTQERTMWNNKADNTDLFSHVDNSQVHVTAQEKEMWNSKADNTALSSHTTDSQVHVTVQEKEMWNSKADTAALSSHATDSQVHVTSSERAAWNNKQNALPIEQTRKITFGTANPSGGVHGDIYLQYE